MKKQNVSMRFKLKLFEKTKLQLLCAFPYNLQDDISLTSNCITEVNKLIDWLRSFPGIFFTGEVEDNGCQEICNKQLHILVYTFKTVDGNSLDLAKQLIKYFGDTVTKKTNERLEIIMGRKPAPYKLWSIDSLKTECGRREFKSSDYKDAKPGDKMVLVALLNADDEAKQTTGTKKTLPAAEKKSKTTGKSRKSKPEPVEEFEEEQLEEVVEEEIVEEEPIPEASEATFEDVLRDQLNEMNREELKQYIRDNNLISLLKENDSPIFKTDDEEAIIDKIINVHPEPEISEPEPEVEEFVDEAPEEEDLLEPEPESEAAEEELFEEPEPDPEEELRDILSKCDRAGLITYIKENLLDELKAAKTKGEFKILQTDEEADLIDKIIDLTVFDDAPAKPEKKKTKSKTEPAKLNDKLKKVNLWRDGCQFLSSGDKAVILKGKGKDVASKKIYLALKKRMIDISKKRSVGLKKAQSTRRKNIAASKK